MDLFNVWKIITNTNLKNVYTDCFVTILEKSCKRKLNLLKIENFTLALGQKQDKYWNGAARLHISHINNESKVSG